MPPTYQQVGQTYDTIIAQAADDILGKLYFYVIISSAIEPKLKSHPQMIIKSSFPISVSV
jgi:hypothetical protein